MRGAVSDLIGELLDDFKIDEACQLSVEYGCSTLDLVVILVCLNYNHPPEKYWCFTVN